jgi:hypothetical protein
MNPDDRSLALEILADSEAELRERIAHLTADVAAYRELAQVAIGALHATVAECERLRGQNHRLVDENRALRQTVGGCQRREAA